MAEQIEFWEGFARRGLPDDLARASALRFREAFDELEGRLGKAPYLFGETLTVLDIAWFIYVNRLSLGAYPFARLHPRVGAWFERLGQRPEFVKEIGLPPALAERFAAQRRKDAEAGKSLEMVAGF